MPRNGRLERGRRHRRPRWRRAFEHEAAELIHVLAAAVRGEPAAVHRARVGSRRIREHLAIVRGALPTARYRKLERRFRDLTRLFGRTRELDVSLVLLDELAGKDPRLTPDLQTLKAAIAAERGRRMAIAARGVRDLRAKKLERALARALDSIEAGYWDWGGSAAAHLKRRGDRLLARVQKTNAVYEPGRLHDARIALKRFRYALEIVSSGPRTHGGGRLPGTKRALTSLKRAQDSLGRLHDLHILAGQVQDQEPALRHRRTVLEVVEREIRAEHARYLATRDDLRALVGRYQTRVTSKAASPRSTTGTRA